jgi:uncharacterized secreted protein with C-terminal beta-propeller domain
MSIRKVLLAVFALALVTIVVPGSASASVCNPNVLGKTIYGTQSIAASALQACLIEIGYSIPAGATGYYGAQTRTAVQEFYRKVLGLTWDGRSFGPQARAKLATLVQGQPSTGGNVTTTGYKRAASATELAKYIAERNNVSSYGFGLAVPTMAGAERSADATTNSAVPATAPAPSRVSNTNVQVRGIDEPDIVKTDGNNLYISKQGIWYGGGPVPMMRAVSTPEASTGGGATASRIDPGFMPPIWQDPSKTLIVDAYPVNDLAVLSKNIEEKGEMLLVKDTHTLIILSQPSIVAYNVTDPKNPVKKWTLSLEGNTSLNAARLTNDTLYLVTQTWLDSGTPCPYIPLTRGSTKITIPCTDIWIPSRIEPVMHTLTMLAVDPTTGTAKQTLAVAENGDTTTVSLFNDAAYIATKSYAPQYDVMMDITIKAYTPFVSAETITKMRTIQGYDLSMGGMLNEITLVAQAAVAQKSADERLRIETEVGNTFQRELGIRKRELDRTRITRVPLANLTVGAVGEIPGTLLNQFSLDEYNGDLRAAVTVGTSWWNTETSNDVYVLGSDLKEKGHITDLGLGERVYSARFVGDKGYLVTFKQVDPFYVLDLSVPTAPKLAGQLKIPGYSAYLEPIGNNIVLGVGREGNGVKLAIYDVSNAANPIEKSKYIIKDSWTDVENNHHAFLRDAGHNVFFIPGSNGGYVFSYANNTLSLKATVAGWSVNRAVYIDDNMYVIGDAKISVLDENTWKVVKELSLQ